jgi:V/A-type H+/Na+-transporting ATPase subunit I
MIVDIRKFLFFGVSSDLEEFVARAQEAGFIEFLPSNGQVSAESSTLHVEILQALKTLKKLPVATPYDHYLSKEQLLDKAYEINVLSKKIEKLQEDLRLNELEINKLKPLGSFDIDDLHYIYEHSGYKFQFFCKSSLNDEPIDPSLLYIGTEYDLDYFVAISKTRLSFPDLIEVKIEHSFNDCIVHKEQLETSLKQAEKQLKSLAKFLLPLEYALGQYHDLEQLKLTYKMASFPLDSSFFTLMAYVPKNNESHVPKILKGLSVHAEVIKAEENEVLPTCFYNKGFAKSGEDLVKIYDIPSCTDKDPSPWVLWTFALFFAMIVSDAGYGFIYLALGLLTRFLVKHKTPFLKRSLNLLKILGISCILWGSLTGSWFGISLSENNVLQRFTMMEYLVEKKAQYHAKVNDETVEEIQKKYCIGNVKCSKDLLEYTTPDGEKPVYDMFFKNILLEISILVGVLHVCSSLLRYLPRNYANFGWVLFAIGGYLYFPSYLHSASLIQFLNIASLKLAADFGYQLILVGIGFSLVVAVLQKKLKGLGEIANLVQVFADILSYLRLYALALASSIMAETFNQMGIDLGLFFGVIVILGGHAINFVLGTMGGVIHGLRLNFIEWYHYSFDGGGKLFKPLRRFTLKS